MLLEIHRFVPKSMFDENAINSNLEELYRVHSMAKYMQEIEVGIMQKAIVQSFSES